MIGNVEYTDLQEAINDVKNGGTIKLVDDVYGGGFDTEKSGMKFTLDLNDNKIINGNEYWIITRNKRLQCYNQERKHRE